MKIASGKSDKVWETENFWNIYYLVNESTVCAKTHRRWRHFKIGDTRLIFAEKIHDGVFRLQSPTVPITSPNLRQPYQKFGKRHLSPRQLSGKLRFQSKVLIASFYLGNLLFWVTKKLEILDIFLLMFFLECMIDIVIQ